MRVPINIAGGTYEHRSRPLAAQVTRNFWPQLQEGGGTTEYSLETPPGLALFSAGSGVDRGMYVHRGTLYKVTGTTLESINSAGARTTLGTIAGSARCIFAGVSSSIVIVSAGSVYEWDGTTLTQGTDSDFESPDAVTVINKQAIYDGSEDRFCTSDVGEPLTINGLNYATAESNADVLLRPYAFGQNIYMFGSHTIETWWNSGDGNPPFDRFEGGLLEVGLAALHSVSHNERFVYFLADDRNPCRLSAGGLEDNFTPAPLVREFSNFADVSDAIGWCMRFHKQNFYFLKFPSANKTFVYPEGGQWFEMSSIDYETDGEGGRYRANSYASVFGKHLMADEDGNIHEFSESVFTDAGETIIRVRDMANIHGGLLNAPGKDVYLSEFTLIMETGVGPADADSPQIMLSFSYDGGRTFGTEMWGDVGKVGEYTREVKWTGLNIVGQNIIPRLSTSDAVYYSLHSAALEIDAGI